MQATFKDLFDNVENDGVIRRIPKRAPEGREVRDLELALEGSLHRRMGRGRAGDLRRGQLAEIEVELEAEDIFRVGAAVGTFLDLLREMPEVVDVGRPWPASGSDVGERPPGQPARWPRSSARTSRGPRHGKGVEGGVGKVHKKALQEWPEGWTPNVRPLDVVAVVEDSRFWKDIRRVLVLGITGTRCYAESGGTVSTRVGRL